MYFKLPSEEDYICVVYHARRMPIGGGVGGSIAPTATAVNQCARWCGGTEHPAHIVKRKRSETKRPPINQNSHLTQNLASDANLACSGNRLAPGASYCT